jgi:hypothetical protein
VFDLSEFAALDLDELRADLVVGGVNRGIDVISDDILGGQFTVAVEVAGEGFTEGVSACDEPRVKAK